MLNRERLLLDIVCCNVVDFHILFGNCSWRVIAIWVFYIQLPKIIVDIRWIEMVEPN